MGNFATMLNAVVTTLTTNKVAIGINTVEKNLAGEPGKIKYITIGNPPGCVVLLVDPKVDQIVHTGAPVNIPTEIAVLCVSGGKANTFDSLDEALTIAMKVNGYLAGKNAGAFYFELTDMEVLQLNSDATVIANVYTTYVDL